MAAARALITGASGLVGSWVLRHWDVPGLEAVPLGSADADLLAPNAMTHLLAEHQADAVVHLAWSASGRADYRETDDNERWRAATLELVDAAEHTGTPLWLTGTVVDDAGADAPDAYSRAKAALRRDVADRVAAGQVGWLQPFYVFDEVRRRPGVVAHALAAAERGEPVTLQTPDTTHDFVHASDVGRAVVTAVRHALRGEVPIGSGRLRTVAALVTALGVPWTPSSQTNQPAAEPAHAEHAADVARLRAVGWAPTRTEELFTDD